MYAMDTMDTRLVARFWARVVRGEGCWEWRGQRNQYGYGQFRLGPSGPSPGAHRVSWALHHDMGVPLGLFVLHRCDNPGCVNPAHLWLGTAKDNAADMDAKGRRAAHYRAHTRKRKLTDDQVRMIRLDDRPAHHVAHDYGVAEGTVYNIRARRRKALVSD